MYICNICNRSFIRPHISVEKHGFISPPFEEFATCPYCKSTEFGSDERKKRYAK